MPFPEFSYTGFQRNWNQFTKELNILKDCYFLMKTVWSVLLSLYSTFYLCDNKYWYDITDMIVCMPGTRKSHFYSCQQFPCYLVWDFDDICGSFLAQNILILSAYCSYCSPRHLQIAFPFPPHQKLLLQLCLAVKTLYLSPFSEYFCWVNPLWEKINQQNTTKQQT